MTSPRQTPRYMGVRTFAGLPYADLAGEGQGEGAPTG